MLIRVYVVDGIVEGDLPLSLSILVFVMGKRETQQVLFALLFRAENPHLMRCTPSIVLGISSVFFGQ